MRRARFLVSFVPLRSAKAAFRPVPDAFGNRRMPLTRAIPRGMREEPMTSLELILLTNAAAKLISALEQLVRSIRRLD